MSLIYAWEAKRTEPTVFWKTVPSYYVGKMVYHNLGVSAEHDHPHNPLEVLKRVVKEDDYVTFKLDIPAFADTVKF